jgi:tRNA pseudouridine38-40 synthase
VEHFNSLSKFVLIVEYDGRRYYGFQWQSGQPTIQEKLEEAIGHATGETRRVIAASRTDTGVHAKYQVVSFHSGSKLSPQILTKALNFYLPRDIAVKTAGIVDNDFDVRSDAISREYEYHILNVGERSPLMDGYAYHVPWRLNLDSMNDACRLLVGEHDFTSFSASSCRTRSTIRTMFTAEFKKVGSIICFNVKANSFLTHQVRNTVGFMINLGSGKRSIDELKRILEVRKKGLGGPAAPPHGLFLTRVSYPRNLELKYENVFN